MTRTERARFNADPICQDATAHAEADAGTSSRLARRIRFLRDCEICCGFHGSKACPSDPRSDLAAMVSAAFVAVLVLLPVVASCTDRVCSL